MGPLIPLFEAATERNLMYQSNWSFNIPTGSPRGIWIFGKVLFKSPPTQTEKLFKYPHPWENNQITVLTFSNFYYMYASEAVYANMVC